MTKTSDSLKEARVSFTGLIGYQFLLCYSAELYLQVLHALVTERITFQIKGISTKFWPSFLLHDLIYKFRPESRDFSHFIFLSQLIRLLSNFMVSDLDPVHCLTSGKNLNISEMVHYKTPKGVGFPEISR